MRPLIPLFWSPGDLSCEVFVGPLMPAFGLLVTFVLSFEGRLDLLARML